MDYTITHNQDGSITMSTIHEGQREHQLYIGYTEKEAEHEFWLYLSQIGV